MLTFDPDTHTYALDEVEVPSVTSILKAAGLIDFSSLPPWVLEDARLRGTRVHHAIHYFNEHDLDVDAFVREFPALEGYLRAWIDFTERRRFVPLLNEYRVASRIHKVAGTLDCLGTLDGRAVLLDFATGRPQDVAKDLQTAAYHGLAREQAETDPVLKTFFANHGLVCRRYAVALRSDGSFRLEAYADPSDWRSFLTLLEARHIVDTRRGAAA